MEGKHRRVAANEVLVGNERLTLCVVEIESAVVTDYYQFCEEQPSTEWLGGTIILKKDGKGCLRAYKNEKLIK